MGAGGWENHDFEWFEGPNLLGPRKGWGPVGLACLRWARWSPQRPGEGSVRTGTITGWLGGAVPVCDGGRGEE